MEGGSRLSLVADVALWTFLFCTFGGLAVGLVGGPVLAVAQGAPGEVVGAYAFFGAPLGMLLGMALGAIGAPVLGLSAAATLVPYRSARRTRYVRGLRQRCSSHLDGASCSVRFALFPHGRPSGA